MDDLFLALLVIFPIWSGLCYIAGYRMGKREVKQ